LALGDVLCPGRGAMPHMGRCPMLVWNGPLALRCTAVASANGAASYQPGATPQERSANPIRGPKARAIIPRNPLVWTGPLALKTVIYSLDRGRFLFKLSFRLMDSRMRAISPR